MSYRLHTDTQHAKNPNEGGRVKLAVPLWRERASLPKEVQCGELKTGSHATPKWGTLKKKCNVAENGSWSGWGMWGDFIFYIQNNTRVVYSILQRGAQWRSWLELRSGKPEVGVRSQLGSLSEKV